MNVPARNEEIGGASFNKPSGRAKILNLPWVRGRCYKNRILTGLGRTMHICKQRNSVAHWNRNVVILGHDVCWLRQVAILTSGGLRTIQFSLPLFEPGRWNSVHVLSPKAIRGALYPLCSR